MLFLSYMYSTTENQLGLYEGGTLKCEISSHLFCGNTFANPVLVGSGNNEEQ